jgi:hypothetical protein
MTNIGNLSVTCRNDEAKPVIYDELSHSLGQEQPLSPVPDVAIENQVAERIGIAI